MEYLSFDEKDPNAEFPKAIASAKAKYESANYKEAIVDLNKAIKIQPKYANSYLLRGMCKAQLKNLKGACQDWKKADKLGSSQAKTLININCKTVDKQREYIEFAVNDSSKESILDLLEEEHMKNAKLFEQLIKMEEGVNEPNTVEPEDFDEGLLDNSEKYTIIVITILIVTGIIFSILN